jgi:pimeloyl-ACP methyl ester carboxylesterase
VLLSLGLSACTGTGTRGQPASSGAGSQPTPPLVERCGSALPSGAAVEPLALDDGAGTRLSAATFGSAGSGTALVLLHQTGPWGLCGWGRFATRAADAGLPSVALDMCGYGDSVCAPGVEHRPATLVDLAARWAREHLGARRVVLVGASMGGSSTVLAVTEGAGVDAWVDVSGVSTWDGVRLQSRAGALRSAAPGLIVFARTDGPSQWRAARRLSRTAGARFVDGGSGHGYELMTDYRGRLLRAGRAVLRFAAA